MKPKINIDALPCNGKSFKIWFWLSIICAVISAVLYVMLGLEMYFKLAFELEESVLGDNILWGIPLAIPISIFGLIIAKSFKSISDTLYKLTLTFAIMPMIQAFLNVLYCFWYTDIIAYMTFLIGFINICLYIAISINISRNYGGLFQELGLGLWSVPLYCIVLVLCMSLLNYWLKLDSIFKTILGIGVDIYCIIICINKILKPLYTLFNNGIKERLTYAEMAEYIVEEENRLGIIRNHKYHTFKYLNNNQEVSEGSFDSYVDNIKPWRKKNIKYLNYVAGGCGALVVVAFIIASEMSKNSKERDNDNSNYSYEEITTTPRDIEVENTADKTLEEEDKIKFLPEWLDYSVLETFDKTDLSEKPYDWLKELFRHSYAPIAEIEKYQGKIDTYPVTVEMKIDKDATVSGRYAYNTTLDKYGDNPSSWFKIRGSVLFDEESYPYIVMETYHPDTGEVYEYALLRYSFPDNWEGRLMNQKYINSDTSKFYSFSFNIEDIEDLL